MNPSFSRTTSRVIRFTRPFTLPGIDGVQPPGDYAVETEEERLEALSFDAWRRIATTIRLSRRPGGPSFDQVAPVDPVALEAALARDVLSQ